MIIRRPIWPKKFILHRYDTEEVGTLSSALASA